MIREVPWFLSSMMVIHFLNIEFRITKFEFEVRPSTFGENLVYYLRNPRETTACHCLKQGSEFST